MSSQKTKKPWEEISGLNADFIRICLEEAARVGYKGTSLKDVSWNRLKEELTTKYSTHEIEFDQKFLKNHWNHLKKKYNAWIACIGRSGHGFNAVTGELDWPQEKWDEVIKRYPEAEKYRKNPLPHAQELYNLFESTLSNGESKLTPAADGMPTDSDATSQTINIGESKDRPTDEDDSYWNEIKFSNNTPIGEQVDKLIAKSKEKKRKIISSTSDPDVKEVVELIKGQLKSTNAQREALLAEKVVEKAEMDNYSTLRCLETLDLLKEFEDLPADVHQKCLLKFCNNAEYRKVFVQLKEVEEKMTFAYSVANF